MVVSELLPLGMKTFSLKWADPWKVGLAPSYGAPKKKTVTANLLTAIDFTRWESESAATSPQPLYAGTINSRRGRLKRPQLVMRELHPGMLRLNPPLPCLQVDFLHEGVSNYPPAHLHPKVLLMFYCCFQMMLTFAWGKSRHNPGKFASQRHR